jgi:hypothetical protein
MAAAVIDILFANEKRPYYSSSQDIVKELASLTYLVIQVNNGDLLI